MRAQEQEGGIFRNVIAIRDHDSPAWRIAVGSVDVAFISAAEGGLYRYSSPSGYLFRNTMQNALRDGLRRDGFTICLRGSEL